MGSPCHRPRPVLCSEPLLSNLCIVRSGTMSWWSRIGNVLRSERLDQELDEEQRFHIEARAEEIERRGVSHEAALEQAARQFGPRLQLRESSRDVRLTPWLESLGRDLRL